MDADERISLIQLKIERARERLRELGAAIKAFHDTKPYVIETKRDPSTRRLIYYLTRALPVPLTVSTIAGDMLQNLRSALDHLAYQLVLVGEGRPGPFTHVYFPIADDHKEHRERRPRQTKGMRADAIHAIDALKPYRGGNDTLWRLHKLNNIDKHRLLITAGSAFAGVNVGPVLQRHMSQLMNTMPSAAGGPIEVPTPEIFVQPADRLFPLVAGKELYIDEPDAEPSPKIEFRLQVEFYEPGLIEGESLTDSLQAMLDEVEKIVLSFKPLLA